MKRDSWTDFPKNSKLNINVATDILKEILKNVGENPEEIQIKELVSYSVYRKERVSIREKFLLGFTVLFAIVPVLFHLPKIAASDIYVGERGLPTCTIHVSSFLPVKKVEAVLHGIRIPVYEVSLHEYTIEPPSTGEVTVNVELVNRQRASEKFTVNDTDVTPPVFLMSEKKDGYVFFYIKDEGVGMDFENSYAILENGDVLTSDYYDATYNYIAFPEFEGKAELFFLDNFKNSLHIFY